MRIAIISARDKDDALINNIARVIAAKYETDVYVVPCSPRLLWILRTVILVTRVSLKGYDLLITDGFLTIGPIISLWARLLGKKSLIIILGKYYDETRHWSTGIIGLLKRWLAWFTELVVLRLADVILSPDCEVTEYLRARRTKTVFYEKKFGLVDTRQFSYDDRVRKEYRKKLNIPDTDPVLMFVGHLSQHEGADAVLRSYIPLSREIDNLWLLFVGSGELEKDISNTIVAEKLKRAKMVGFIPHAEVQNYMMVGDIALTLGPTSLPHCGIGMTTLELMALGIPVLFTDKPMPRTVIIDWETGFNIKGGVEEVVQRIKTLLGDPALVKKMKRNARERIGEAFTLEAFASRFFPVIDTCMKS